MEKIISVFGIAYMMINIGCVTDGSISDNSIHQETSETGEVGAETDNQYLFDSGMEQDTNRIVYLVDTGEETIPFSCPNSCLNIANDFDCQGAENTCISSWSPSFQQYCLQDKKYCSPNDWAMYCLTQRYSCQDQCTAACNNCSDDHLCNIQAYQCKESCQQE